MKRGVRFLCLLTSLMLFAASAMADDLSEARRLLEEGKYQQALDAVDQNGDKGCFVRMDVATQFSAYDITSIVPGLLLWQDGMETVVLESAVYMRENATV